MRLVNGGMINLQHIFFAGTCLFADLPAFLSLVVLLRGAVSNENRKYPATDRNVDAPRKNIIK